MAIVSDVYKSNITIASNVYIRKETNDYNWQNDKEFIRNVSGENALKDLKANSRGMQGVKMSQMQVDELEKSFTSCAGNHNRGQAYGRVYNSDGTITFECRCETTTCPYVSYCKPVKIIRENEEVIKTTETENNLALEWFGIEKTDDIFNGEYIESIAETEEIDAEAEKLFIVDSSEYKSIKTPDIIIKSDLASKILVNAAPGTGKTYTAIRRLEYLLTNSSIEDYSSILVLCYTRAAVGEINKRIKKGIANKEIPFDARQVTVCTFDSLATNYLLDLIEENELALDINSLNYNERIKAFNQNFKAEIFEAFEYVIIDELQDLVNDRALMTLNIIGALKCGYLLLGDKCQAIYDYDCKGENSIKSTEFYSRLELLLTAETKKYEIIGNKRQSKDLDERAALLREALLTCQLKEIKYLFTEELKNITISDVTAEKFKNENPRITTAILCRNNGEAEYVSWLLHKNKVKHTLLRNVAQAPTFNRWISDVFWDYRHQDISCDEFCERYELRLSATKEDALIAWSALCEVCYEEEKDYIECGLLAKKLCRSAEFSSVLCNEQNNSLVVSTIHKAKGLEFDKVYLIGYDYSSDKDHTEEERVMYVAETRSKQQLFQLPTKFNRRTLRKSSGNRWVSTFLNIKTYKNGCDRFAIGFYDDIDYSTFAEGELKNAVERQEYIAENVSAGDNIELVYQDGEYLISHKEKIVGKASKNFINSLQDCFRDRDIPLYGFPIKITNLFVSNIFTYVSYREFDNIPAWFRDNRFWLSLEITGFGKLKWN